VVLSLVVSYVVLLLTGTLTLSLGGVIELQ
jgi:hypothetical protein